MIQLFCNLRAVSLMIITVMRLFVSLRALSLKIITVIGLFFILQALSLKIVTMIWLFCSLRALSFKIRPAIWFFYSLRTLTTLEITPPFTHSSSPSVVICLIRSQTMLLPVCLLTYKKSPPLLYITSI